MFFCHKPLVASRTYSPGLIFQVSSSFFLFVGFETLYLIACFLIFMPLARIACSKKNICIVVREAGKPDELIPSIPLEEDDEYPYDHEVLSTLRK